eukprot:3653769-Pleurochrysis_carterae.AAC.1
MSDSELLSKKVAQLTKVIALLNTRNEDAEAKLAQVKTAAEHELSGAIADAKAKIVAAIEKGTKQKAAEKDMQDRLKALEKEYETEKKKGLKAIETAKEQEAKRADERIAAATKQLDVLRGELEARCTELERVTGAMRCSGERDKEMASKHKMELEAVVQHHNKKYNEMLKEQLAEQERLNAKVGELEKAMAAERQTLEKRRVDELRSAADDAREARAVSAKAKR